MTNDPFNDMLQEHDSQQIIPFCNQLKTILKDDPQNRNGARTFIESLIQKSQFNHPELKDLKRNLNKLHYGRGGNWNDVKEAADRAIHNLLKLTKKTQ